MDSEITIVILTEDQELRKNLIGKIKEQEKYVLKADFDSGSDCINYLSSNSCDLLIVDLILMEIDGLGIVKRVKEINYNAFRNIICISNFSSGMIFDQLEKLKIDYYFKKPLNYNYFMEIIKNIVNATTINKIEYSSKINNEKRVHDILIKMGMPRHLRGFYYLVTGTTMVIENINLLSEITRELYPRIARAHGTTASRVEQSIRHIIKNTWENGDQDELDDVFGYRINHRPRNSEFISTIVDKLLLEIRQ